jgi:hypothetical protein
VASEPKLRTKQKPEIFRTNLKTKAKNEIH